MTRIYLYLDLYLDISGGKRAVTVEGERSESKKSFDSSPAGLLLADWERKWLVICLGEKGAWCVCAWGGWGSGAGRGLVVGRRKRRSAPVVCFVA